MIPYFAMLGLPAALGLFAVNRRRLLLFVGIIYFLMIGFRYQVGMDWFNYGYIYRHDQSFALSETIFEREPGFVFLNRLAGAIGKGPIIVNAFSALIFSAGLFAFAKRCKEPMLAIVVATPLLAIALAMSGLRQAIAIGFIFLLFATWERHRTATRLAIVMLAALFHFSAIFVAIFVTLAARATALVRFTGATIVGAIVLAVSWFAPASFETYSRLYVGAERKLTAPGAIAQLTPIALAGLLYLALRKDWERVHGDNPLYRSLAWAAVIALPAISVSSVGAYRFALYFWPIAMFVWSGLPAMIQDGVGRAFYRFSIVTASFALLAGWLLLGNNSWAWVPYRSWLLQPPGAPLFVPVH